MKKYIYILLFVSICFNANAMDDSLKISHKKIKIFHETIGTAIYQYLNNFSERKGYTKNNTLYLTGGLGYNINSKWSVSFNYWFNKINKTKRTADAMPSYYLYPNSYVLKNDGGFNFTYSGRSYKINSQKSYFWLSATRRLQSLDLNIGLGGGKHLYNISFFDDSNVKEKIYNWIAVADLSYRVDINKTIYFESNIGLYGEYYYKGIATSDFNFDQDWFKQALVTKGSGYYINSYNDVKDIYCPTSTSIQIRYKYLGILHDMYYPRVGIRIGIKLY